MARTNASVKRFQRVMAVLPKQVAVRADAFLAAQAADLASQIKAVTPVGETGALRNSVRFRKGRKPLSYSVSAGGPTTTPGSGTFLGEFRNALAKSPRGKAAGLSDQGLYDYARAVEFGAGDRPAHPFFFPTYRRGKRARKLALSKECAKALKEYFDNA